jgi:cell division septal protein FtsQ
VAEAALRRRLPGTIEVRVRERHPVGIARLRGELYLVDGTGAVVDEFGPRHAEFDLPMIDGLVTVPPDGEPAIDPARAEVVARVVASMQGRPDLSARISQIDVGEVHDVKVILRGDPAVVRLGAERFAERLQSYVELAPALRARVPQIDYVDLRYGERIYVGPSHTAAGAHARAAGGARPPTED